MKKIILAFLMPGLFVAPAAALDWWLRPTICKPSNAVCYKFLPGEPGFADEWDDGAACRGKKIICAKAIAGGAAYDDEAFSKARISDPFEINPDFDISALDSKVPGCFGVRKTRNNGTSAKVGADWVNVYCIGALDAPDEILTAVGRSAPGGIMLDPNRPTCEELKDRGYIGILNGQCYGKDGYPPEIYHLECADGKLLPELIVKSNSAEYVDVTENKPSYPLTEEEATALFNEMIKKAAEMQRAMAEKG